jgi:hypothetical protein
MILGTIKLLVVDVIDAVENYGLSDADFHENLKNAFETPGSSPRSPPQRKTILLPSCNVTPTKRKQNAIAK